MRPVNRSIDAWFSYGKRAGLLPTVTSTCATFARRPIYQHFCVRCARPQPFRQKGTAGDGGGGRRQDSRRRGPTPSATRYIARPPMRSTRCNRLAYTNRRPLQLRV